jgi:hypothetical protein
MENIQKHIEHDKKILDDPLVSSQYRRHVQEELDALERYRNTHPQDDSDPSSFDLYCNDNPGALECRIYED